MNYSQQKFNVYFSFGYLLALIFFLFLAVETYSFESKIVAWILFVLGTYPLFYYVAYKPGHVPIAEMFLFTMVNAFSLPVFFQSYQKIYIKTLHPDQEPVTYCLLMAVLAVCVFWVSYKIAPSILRGISVPRIHLVCRQRKLYYYGLFLCVISILSGLVSFGSLQGLVNIVASKNLGIALLALLFYAGDMTQKMKMVSLLVLAVVVLNGVASGMVGNMFMPLFIWYICRWLVTKKFELSIILAGVVVLVLLQPVKLEYRNTVWQGSVGTSQLEKINKFANIFYDYWIDGSGKVVESTYSRSSLLLQTSHVIDWTPKVVPYRNGETLYFMFVTFIPRFIWPDKPTAQQANIFYALDYGVTTREGVKTAMFGVGLLGESYMNFGVLGVLFTYVLIGFLSYLPLHMLVIPKNIFANKFTDTDYIAPVALLLSIIIGIITLLGSTVADVYGGVIQMIVIQGFLLYYIAGVRNKSRLIY